MKNAARLAVVVGVLLAAAVAPAQDEGFAGPFGGSQGARLNGVSLQASLPQNGAAPSISVLVNLGYTCGLRVVVEYDGKEMWSAADIDSTVGSDAQILEPSAGDRRDVWEYIYEFPNPTPGGAFAFDGDEVTIYAWVYDASNNELEFSETVVFDLPGTIKHAIVESSNMAAPTSALYAEYVASGATTYVYGEGGAQDFPHAWASIDRNDWDSVDNRSNNQVYVSSLEPEYYMPNDGGVEDRRWLTYLPFEDIIPPGSLVLDGRINCANNGSMYQGHGDTLVAILMTNAGDGLWHDPSNQGMWVNEPEMVFTSWKNQIQGYDDGMDAGNETELQSWGAPATSIPWDPTVDARTCYYDWGRWLQGTSEPHPTFGFNGQASAARFLDGDWYGWRISRLVQKAVDGEVNNGIMLAWRKDSAPAANILVQHQGSAANTELPFYSLSWIEGVPYTPALPLAADGKEADCIFVFTSDDGLLSPNTNWADEFVSRGLSYSMYMQGSWIGYNASYCDASDLVNFRAVYGLEVGTHGRIGYHSTTYDTTGVGPAFWTPDMAIACQDPTEFGDFDEQLSDVDPCWMTDQSYVNSHGEGPIFPASYANDPYVGKTYSVNLGSTSLATLLATKRNELLVARRLSIGRHLVRPGTFPAGDWYSFGSAVSQPSGVSALAADTNFAVFPAHNAAQPFNYMAFLNTCQSNDLVGGDADTPSQAVVVQAFRNRMTGYALNGVRLVSVFTHDDKIPGGSFTEGISATEMGWILDEAQARNMAVMRLYDFQLWRLRMLNSTATPSGWGHYAAWQSPKGSGLWGRLSWVDACKIQGVVRQGS